MSDPGYITTSDSYGEVTFYTHWGGSRINQTLARALKRGRSRWDDTAYLNRIIFSEIVKGQEREITGFGIMNGAIGDLMEDPIVVHLLSKVIYYKGGKFDYEAWIQAFGVSDDND